MPPTTHPTASLNPRGLHLPSELVFSITSHLSPILDQPTLASLASVDRRYNTLVAPLVTQTTRIRTLEGLISYIKQPRARSGKLPTHLDIRVDISDIANLQSCPDLLALVKERPKYLKEQGWLETLHITTWDSWERAGPGAADAASQEDFSSVLDLQAPVGGPRHFRWRYGTRQRRFTMSGEFLEWDEIDEKRVPPSLSLMTIGWPRMVSITMPLISAEWVLGLEGDGSLGDHNWWHVDPGIVSAESLMYCEMGVAPLQKLEIVARNHPFKNVKGDMLVCCYRDDSPESRRKGKTRRKWRLKGHSWTTEDVRKVSSLDKEVEEWKQMVQEESWMVW
ncbi:hypothetical protein IAT38_001697 [Cryptococcus sp. DSM 104549]